MVDTPAHDSQIILLNNDEENGNTWKDSHSVDKRYFVADIGAGIGISAKRFKLTYGVIYRTKEFKSQSSNGQLFGSFLITLLL